jgi:hypothetical protein
MTDVQLALLVLALLFIKHWFADFVVQFDYMVEQKGIYGAEGGIHHSLIHVCIDLGYNVRSFSKYLYSSIHSTV